MNAPSPIPPPGLLPAAARFGLLGEHLAHSYSRELHALVAPYHYELIELPPTALAPFLAARQFRGLNVTIPYKQAVIPLLDDLSPTARAIGAVNTIVNRDGHLFGDNTDAAGFAALLHHVGLRVQGRRCIVLGTGGTSRTAAYVLRREGAARVFRVSRAPGPTAAPDVISYADAARLHADVHLLVNTTPVGMFPRPSAAPLDLSAPSAFPALEGVLDVVYHPLRSRLVLDALRRGLPAAGGLYMLAAQAVHASALFRDLPPDPALADSAWRALRDQKRNLVLVGMPSSGKSTVGRLLADLAHRPFLDTDALVVARAGRSIPQIFATDGEPAFRQLERETLAEVAARDGLVIATGGGAVLDPRNVEALRQNGLCIFLDRPLDLLLATSDPPLSSSLDALRRLYADRLPLYRAAADLVVSATRPPAELAAAILQESRA